MVMLLQAHNAVKDSRSTMMFTFEFGPDGRDTSNLQAILDSFVVQALCFLLRHTSVTDRPRRVLKALRHSNPQSDLVTLFEMVNFWLHDKSLRPLWVLWGLDRYGGDVGAILGELQSCCRFSEISPSILFVGGESETISTAMKQHNIPTLVLPETQSPDPETGATSDAEALTAVNPGLSAQHTDDLHRTLDSFLPDPKLYRIVLQSIRKMIDPDTATLNFDVYQPHQPEVIFQNILQSIPHDHHRQVAILLPWIARSHRTFTISEIATVLSLESFMTKAYHMNWRRYAATRFQKSQQDLEQAEDDLCGMITLEANRVQFAHPSVEQIVSEEGWWHVGVRSHLHILRRLLHLLELEAEYANNPSECALTSSQLGLYATQHWSDHYRDASRSKALGQLAKAHVKEFLKNEAAVQYLLACGDFVGLEELTTAASHKVALLTRWRFDIDSIEELAGCSAWITHQDLVFAGFLGAVNGSFTPFVQKLAATNLKDLSRIETILNKASIIANPEIMEALFDNIPCHLGVKIPVSFLQKAMDLGLQGILDNILNQPGWLPNVDLSLMFERCATSGYTKLAALIEKDALKKPDTDPSLMLNKVLDAAAQNGNPEMVSYVLGFRQEYSLDLWTPLRTACKFGNHEAATKILDSLDDLKHETWDSHGSVLTISVGKGFERCTERILKSLSVAEEFSDIQEVLRTALVAGVHNAQPNTCRQLLSFPALLEDETLNECFWEAISNQRLELVRIFVENGVPIDTDIRGYPPLSIAAGEGDVATVEYLLSNGASVEARSAKDGGTSLIYAVDSQKRDMVRLLLKYGADPRASITVGPYKGWSALEAAARRPEPEIMKMIVHHSRQPDLRRLVEWGGGHATALYLAATYNMIESVELLLEGDIDLEFEREFDSNFERCFTALTAASAYGYADIAQMLLERGANVNHVEERSGHHTLGRVTDEQTLIRLLEYNPNSMGLNQGLNSVSRSGQSISSVKRLLNAGADPNAVDSRDEEQRTPLVNACFSDNSSLEMIQLLVDRGANIQGVTVGRGGSPLHVACVKKGLDVVQLLFDAGADINLRLDHLGTPLQSCCASRLDQEPKIRWLIEKGADVNAEGSFHYDILTWASFQASVYSVNYLVEHGAEVKTPNKVDCLPVFAACLRTSDCQDLVQKLLALGPDLAADVRDKMGRTILHYAAHGGDLDLVKWLIDNDQSLISARDSDGWTAIHWALRTPFTWSDSSYRNVDVKSASRQEMKAAVVRLLVDRGCPGIHGTVQVGYDDKWTSMQVARYFSAPEAVQKELSDQLGLLPNDLADGSKFPTGWDAEGGFCDGCYSVSQEEWSPRPYMLIAHPRC